MTEDASFDEKALQAQLEALLKEEPPNWRLIESLSRQVVDSNPDEVRFSVDAGHIQRLGEQLVGRQETAVSELIKNAFDADATKVSLTFRNHDRIGGILTIDDDGNGMPEAAIRSAWMRISTAAKQEEPISPRFGRQRAGQKGIGRFAVQRLGSRLVLTTRPRGEEVGYRVTFEWDTDFKAGADLNDIYSRIERFSKTPDDHGTKLVISELRDAWPPRAIESVWRSVILLQAPFDVVEAQRGDDAHENELEPDPGFRVDINGVSQDKQRALFSIEKSFLDHALATIEAEIDDRGQGHVRVRSRKLGLDERAVADERFMLVGPMKLEASYFIYLASVLSGITANVAGDMGRRFGGIRIYRNGFRVFPYGEPTDDWLRLDLDVSRRSLLVPGNNRNFFGAVSLGSSRNPLFEETSSREGLLENEAFEELRQFVRWAIEWAALRVAEIRERKQTSIQPGFVSKVRKPSEIIQSIRPEDFGSGGPDGVAGMLQELASAAKAYEDKVEADREQALQYEEMLRILASLGLSISMFGHEVKGAQGGVSSNIALLEELVEELPASDDRVLIAEQLEQLRAASERLFDLGGYIAGLMSSTESRELRDLSVKGAIDRFVRQFGSYMTRQKIAFEVDVQPLSLRTSPMHSSEFDSVLLNFLTNSIKSLRKAKVVSPTIRISARSVGDQVVLAFEDNGVGIPEEHWTRVFRPFFTTTMNTDEDGVVGPGTGLGLKIVSDIAESYGGEARVAEPSSTFTCRMEFSVLAFREAGV